MNRIDRYVSGLFWLYFAGGLLVFITLFIAIDAMSMLVNYAGVSGSAWLQYYLYSLPDVVTKMIPVACLLGTIFTISTLSRSHELVALYSVGMSLYRITTPILIWVCLVSLLSFGITDRLTPVFTRNKNFVFYHDIKKNPALYSTTKKDRIWYRSKDTIFNIKTLNDQEKKAQGLTLYYFNEDWDLLQMVTAKEVAFKGSNWELKEGSVTLFTADSSFPLTSSFVDKTIVMGEDSQDLSSTGNTSDVLSMSELKDYIQRNKAAGLDTLRYEVDYQSKYGFAFSALVMCLLAIPFSVGKARGSGIMVNVGLCLGLVFAYWIFYNSSLTLANHGQIPPIVAAWAPNAIMILLALRVRPSLL